jgi:hypothetical protein
MRLIEKENLQCVEDLCKDDKGSEAVHGMLVVLYLLYIPHNDCDKLLTSYTECICKSHIETSKELFDGKTVSFRLNTVPRYFLYVWEYLPQLNTLFMILIIYLLL